MFNFTVYLSIGFPSASIYSTLDEQITKSGILIKKTHHFFNRG